MEFSRQEYWSALPGPPPGDLPNSGILRLLHWQADSLPQVQSLGWEDLLEDGMATHSSIFAWRIPWTEELEGL